MKKRLTKDEILNFTEEKKNKLINILDNPCCNERDHLLPFFRENPLPLVLALVTFPEFIWIEREFDFKGQYFADFIIATYTSMGHDYHLIELEQHNFRYFTKKGKDISSKFSHALTQIFDWNVFWENNNEYLNTKLKPIQGNVYDPANYIIMGRRGDISEKIVRKYAYLTKKIPTLKCMSYDRIYDACDLAIKLSKKNFDAL